MPLILSRSSRPCPQGGEVYPYESFSVKKYMDFVEGTREEAKAFAERTEEARKGIAFL